MGNLAQHAKETGQCFLGTAATSQLTMPNGDFRASVNAWDNGPITYHLRGFTGYIFEIYERLELAKDGTNLVITQRIIGASGVEQKLTVNMPVSQ